MTFFINKERAWTTPIDIKSAILNEFLFKTGWCSIFQVNIYTIVSFYCVEFIVLLFTG